MEENVTRLTYCGKQMILIATAHVSKESAELVKQVIEAEKPDSVCVELDEQRYAKLQDPKAWESMDIVKVIKSPKSGLYDDQSGTQLLSEEDRQEARHRRRAGNAPGDRKRQGRGRRARPGRPRYSDNVPPNLAEAEFLGKVQAFIQPCLFLR
jgi:hypothetical protein